MSSNTNVWTYDLLWFILLCWDKTAQSNQAFNSFVHFLTLAVISCLVRPREHHLLVSAGTRRTPCAVVVGPRLTTSRSPHVASAGTLRSARESVSIPLLVLNFSFISLWTDCCCGQCLWIWCLLMELRMCRKKTVLWCTCLCFVDNWSAKAKRRSTTGTGRLRHLKVVYRRFR